MSILPGLQFGSGFLLASPQTSSGNPAPDPTPLQVGVIQNIKFTLGADIKSLFGQNQWPVDSAVGKRSIKGSFEFAQANLRLPCRSRFLKNLAHTPVDRFFLTLGDL